jgi:hypothetical protein
MEMHEDRTERDYDVGSLTTSYSKDTQKIPLAREIIEEREEANRYSSGKPSRIVIRAKIIHD